jgi:hypothetical protein
MFLDLFHFLLMLPSLPHFIINRLKRREHLCKNNLIKSSYGGERRTFFWLALAVAAAGGNKEAGSGKFQSM